MGLSYLEINEMRVCDLIDLSKSYSNSDEDEKVEATQEDIDAFFR